MTAQGRASQTDNRRKLLASLIAVGLLPWAAMVLIVGPNHEQLTHMKQMHTDLFVRYNQLYEINLELEKQLHQLKYDHNYSSRLQEAQSTLLTLVSILTPMAIKPKQESWFSDPTLHKIIEKETGLFTHTALLHPSTDTALVLGSNQPAGPVEDMLPELAQRKKNLKDKKTKLDFSSWYWMNIADGEYQLAVRMPKPPARQTPPENWTQTPKVHPPQYPGLNPLPKSTQSPGSIATWSAALFGLFLALATYVWIRARMFSPIEQLTQSTRNVFENPSGSEQPDVQNPGFLKDLYAYFSKLPEKLQRIELLEQRLDNVRTTSHHLCNVLGEAAREQIGVRAVIQPGDLEEVAAGINRMLDTLAEKLKAFQQSSLKLQSSSKQMQELSVQLTQVQKSRRPTDPPENLHSMHDLLGHELDALCRQAQAFIVAQNDAWKDRSGNLESSAPETQISPLSSASGGLRLLAQQIHEVQACIDHISALQPEINILTINLSIATEARSWSQMESLTLQTTGLSDKLTNLMDSLSRDLKELALMGKTLEELTQQATHLFDQHHEQWHRFNTFMIKNQQLQSTLLQKIKLVHPIAGSLSSELSKLAGDMKIQHDSNLAGEELIGKIGSTAGTLAFAAGEVVSQITEMSIDKPSPAAWTQNLARSQRTLERAMRYLINLASQEGIEILKSDTQTILDNIRSVAEQAQKRLSQMLSDDNRQSNLQPERRV